MTTTTAKSLNEMSEEELSDYYYEHPEAVDEDFDWEHPIESAPAKTLGVNASVRFGLEEHRAMREAAEEAGVNISEWIRTACAAALARGADPGMTAVAAALESAQRSLDRVKAQIALQAAQDDLDRARKLVAEAAVKAEAA